MLVVPQIFERNGKEGRAMDLFARLMTDRVIMLGSGIDEDVSQVVCAQLLYLDAQDSQKPIYLYINSPGGSVTDGLAIYDTMEFIEAPVTTVCMGQACSMGAFLLAAGKRRYSLPHGQILIHQPSSGVAGQCTDIQIHARQAQYYKDLLNEILSKRSKKSVVEMTGLTERDTFLTPQQAMEIGLIDGILKNKADIRQKGRANLQKKGRAA